MKHSHLFFYLLLTFLFVATGIIFFFRLFPRYMVLAEFPVTITVAEYAGLDISPSLHFQIPPGAAADKRIVVENNSTTARNITVNVYELSSWVIVMPSSLLISPEENASLAVQVFVPENTLFGNYSGRVVLYSVAGG